MRRLIRLLFLRASMNSFARFDDYCQARKGE